MNKLLTLHGGPIFCLSVAQLMDKWLASIFRKWSKHSWLHAVSSLFAATAALRGQLSRRGVSTDKQALCALCSEEVYGLPDLLSF